MSNLFQELKRRNVFKVAAAYVKTIPAILSILGISGANLIAEELYKQIVTILKREG